jgi:hypothetical protein
METNENGTNIFLAIFLPFRSNIKTSAQICCFSITEEAYGIGCRLNLINLKSLLAEWMGKR